MIECRQCPSNTYSLESAGLCTKCPEGSLASEDHSKCGNVHCLKSPVFVTVDHL